MRRKEGIDFGKEERERRGGIPPAQLCSTSFQFSSAFVLTFDFFFLHLHNLKRDEEEE